MAGYQRLMYKAEDLGAINKLARTHKWQVNWDFQQELLNNDKVIVVTDSWRQIVFASQNIFDMTGYSAAEVKGKSPKMFQGTDTDASVVYSISTKLVDKKPFDTVVLNYKKNGEPYNCHIKGFPIFNQQNELVNFIAFEQAA